MSITEIRKGLRRLDFTPNESAAAHLAGTHVVVEFEVAAQLAADQLILINLGLRNGIARELTGKPQLLAATGGSGSSFRYRLEGDVA
jgi:hypothetical protein